jgi:XRE family aerobic/anaerobic benzoate catabolism transcriptional regulator
MEGNPQAMGHLKDLLLSREALYGRASAQVDTSNKPINSSLNELLAVIANRGFLEPGP